jgi:hypothetical protein
VYTKSIRVTRGVRGTLAIPHPIHQAIYFSLVGAMSLGSVSRPRVARRDGPSGGWGAGRGVGRERHKRASHRVSMEFRRHGIPRNFLTSEVIFAQFRRNSAKFRGIPRNFAGIAPGITSVFRGMPKCHFRGHPSLTSSEQSLYTPNFTIFLFLTR